MLVLCPRDSSKIMGLSKLLTMERHTRERIIIFVGENYDEWEDNLVNHLKSKNIYKPVNAPRPDEVKLVKGDASNAIEYRRACELLYKWESMYEAAQGKIHARLKLKIKVCQTAKEMIEKVKSIYAS